ncbi:MAG: TPM domain-containing protein [Lachnospira sp.]
MIKSNILSGKVTRITAAVVMLIMSVVMLVSALNCSEVEVEAAQDIQYVIDDAGIISDSEEAKLNKLCNKVSKDCGIDMIIVTTRKGHDYGVFDEYMENLIKEKYGNYRYDDKEYSAVVFGIDMVSRAYRFCATGKARVNVTDGVYRKISDDAAEYLSDGDYYGACKYFVKHINNKLNDSIVYKLFYKWYIKLAISLVVAVIAVLIMMYNAKAHMTVADTTYTKNHQFRVNDRRDIFVNTTVVKHHIQTNNGGSHGGGGGGGHSGHGGGHF